MEAKVTWEKELSFMGVADSGYPIKMDSESSTERGAGPMEMLGMALAACTAMDVISILLKKQQKVTYFEVKFHGERAKEHPRRLVKGVLDYVVKGRKVEEKAILRAIELSLTKYCSVHATLHNAFPLDLHYSIYEDDELIKQGVYQL